MSTINIFAGNTPHSIYVRGLAEKYAKDARPVLVSGPDGSGRTRLAEWLHECRPNKGSVQVFRSLIRDNSNLADFVQSNPGNTLVVPLHIGDDDRFSDCLEIAINESQREQDSCNSVRNKRMFVLTCVDPARIRESLIRLVSPRQIAIVSINSSERRGDIPQIIRAIVDVANRDSQKSILAPDCLLLEALSRLKWRDEVRELRSAIVAAYRDVKSHEVAITRKNLPPDVREQLLPGYATAVQPSERSFGLQTDRNNLLSLAFRDLTCELLHSGKGLPVSFLHFEKSETFLNLVNGIVEGVVAFIKSRHGEPDRITTKVIRELVNPNNGHAKVVIEIEKLVAIRLGAVETATKEEQRRGFETVSKLLLTQGQSFTWENLHEACQSNLNKDCQSLATFKSNCQDLYDDKKARVHQSSGETLSALQAIPPEKLRVAAIERRLNIENVRDGELAALINGANVISQYIEDTKKHELRAIARELGIDPAPSQLKQELLSRLFCDTQTLIRMGTSGKLHALQCEL